MRRNAAIAVLLDQGRDAAIRRMEILYDLAVAKGFHVYWEMFREAPLSPQDIRDLYWHVKAVFVDKLETLGRTQRECIISLTRILRNGIESVYVLTHGNDLIEIDHHTLQTLKLFGRLDVVLASSKQIA
jgi:hypothetical protein